MNCSDELRLQKLLDDRHEMERLRALATSLESDATDAMKFERHGNQVSPALMHAKMETLARHVRQVASAAGVLLSEKLESSL